MKVPKHISLALWAHPAARKAFEHMPPSHQWKYIQWIMEAKKESTRQERTLKAMQMMVVWERQQLRRFKRKH